MGKALEFIMAEPWAILPEKLEQISAIAQRHGDSPEALAAKLGRPLDNTRHVEIRDGAAIIPIHGPIFRYANLFTEISGAVSLEILARDFSTALDDPAIDRIVLDIDSPGGQAAGISEFAAMISEADKPVAAYVGSIGASAAYWIASAADRIFMSDAAMVGSIGVVGTYRAGPKDAIKIISSQSPLKQASPETETGRVEMQRVIDDLADVFIGSVAKYRGVDRETVMSDYGRGGVLVGEKAVSAGMADAVSSLESVIAGVSGETDRGIFMSKEAQMPEINREYLAEHHPDIVTAIELDAELKATDAGLALGREQGAQTERDRVQAVFAQTMPGHESLIQGMAFDGKTTGPEAAVAVLAAEKASRVEHLNMQANSATPPLPGVPDKQDSGSGIDPNLPVEQRCAAEWDSKPELRKEFGHNLDTYIAFTRAEENGRVRRIGGKG